MKKHILTTFGKDCRKFCEHRRTLRVEILFVTHTKTHRVYTSTLDTYVVGGGWWVKVRVENTAKTLS